MNTAISIQQAAAATGLSVHTLRYYERIGLIDPVSRLDNQHRLYREDDMRWIAFLLKLRATGMSIQQMLRYAELRRSGDDLDSVSERKAMLVQHTAALEAELLVLQETLTVLHGKVAMYASMEEKLKEPVN
ncbi:MerR family transcriptional regulator [Paraherbaspirillum soli]|uniref:MerR family transcriptional regulator n=1 Tax=Paraherbaspirillum soli TaxID=631222 RepID=A0ABW0M7C6_9BURK